MTSIIRTGDTSKQNELIDIGAHMGAFFIYGMEVDKMADAITSGRVDLGAVSAYAVAVANGFVGTEAEWEQYIANASQNAIRAEAARVGAEEAIAHSPKIQNGTWWVYDIANQVYVDTGYAARGEVGSEYTVMIQETQPTEETNKLWVPLNEEQYTEVLTVGDLPANKVGNVFHRWARRVLGNPNNPYHVCVCIDNGWVPSVGDYVTIIADQDCTANPNKTYIDFCSDNVAPETTTQPPESMILGLPVEAPPSTYVANTPYMYMYAGPEKGLVLAESYLRDPTIKEQYDTLSERLDTDETALAGKASLTELNNRMLKLTISATPVVSGVSTYGFTWSHPSITANHHVIDIIHDSDYDLEWSTADGSLTVTNATTQSEGMPAMTILLGYFTDITSTVESLSEIIYEEEEIGGTEAAG